MSKYKFDPHPGKFETFQEAIEYAYIQLLRQGCQSETMMAIGDDLQKTCAYRGNGGAKCFVGHLWPDSTYDDSFENVSFPHVILPPSQVKGSSLSQKQSKQRQLKGLIEAVFHQPLTAEDCGVIGEFQAAHDTAFIGQEHDWVISFKKNCAPLFEKQGWTPPRLNLQPVL